MTTEERKKIIEISFDHLIAVLRNIHLPVEVENPAAGETHLSEGDIFRIATKLISEGFLLKRVSSWEYDDLVEGVVCNSCLGRALVNPNAPDEITLSDYCPHCGAAMNSKEDY